MGMYTEVFFRAEVDEYAWGVLSGLIEDHSLPESDPHPFFKKPRALQVFSGGSYYFPGARHSIVSSDLLNPSDPMRFVSFRADLKNYDGEIDSFFDWVTPHVKSGGGFPREMIGYSLYEEDASPRIYYKEATYE